MLVNVHAAKSQLSKLIVAAEAGDDVIYVSPISDFSGPTDRRASR